MMGKLEMIMMMRMPDQHAIKPLVVTKTADDVETQPLRIHAGYLLKIVRRARHP